MIAKFVAVFLIGFALFAFGLYKDQTVLPDDYPHSDDMREIWTTVFMIGAVLCLVSSIGIYDQWPN